MNKNNHLRALDFALSTKNYENVIYKGRWHGYEIYTAVCSADVGKLVGLPAYILVKDNDVRWATTKETYQILKYTK